MLNGIYTIGRGMVAFEKEKEVISNNLANSSTIGFKGQQVVYQSFPEMLLARLDAQGQHIIGTKGMGARVVATATDFRSGNAMKTDNSLDLAIEGAGFFAVQTPTGVAYTRSGHFTINDLGELVTEEGYQVLGQSGPIQTMNREMMIGEDGSITIEGVQDDMLRFVDFDNLDQLEKLGHNLFRPEAGVAERPANGVIRQGFLEASNINIILGMTQMITATRMYEMSQKSIQSQDETLAKAVNEVGRVNG